MTKTQKTSVNSSSPQVHIATWNVNSVNARAELVTEFIQQERPDILLLQEIKCMEEKFCANIFEDFGYNMAVFGQKSYNGVAILSKYPINDIKRHCFEGGENEARYLECIVECEGKTLRCASVYVPNGSIVGSSKFHAKLRFIEDMDRYLRDLLRYDEITLVGGDFNVAPGALDVYDAEYFEDRIGFHIEERKRIHTLLNNGYIDAWRALNQGKSQFSWWDYRQVTSFAKNLGMRIDYIVASPLAMDFMVDSKIHSEFRAKPRPSDHVPVSCYLKF
jgi:exodeoxyribonuclease-3